MGRRLIIFEKTSNKTPDISKESTNVQYPGAKAVAEAVAKVQSEVDKAYQKPAGGIPKSDLSGDVRQSLDKADSAYQKPADGIPRSDLSDEVQKSLEDAYQKPQDGIPRSDLSEAVRQSLDNADSAYQKPEGGIPKSDMSPGVQDSLDNADDAIAGLSALRSEVASKSDKVSSPTPGDLASLDADGNLEDSGIAKSAFQPGATSGDRYTKESFVNSSIATNTATFRGTYNLVSDLGLTISATHEQTAAALASKLAELSIVPEHNDYCFVQVPTSNLKPSEISHVDRYKCNVSESDGTVTRTWAYEWSLNNSSFTAEQWAAINSGITSSDVAKLSGIAAGAQVNVIEGVRVNGVQLTPDAGKKVDVAVPTKPEDIGAKALQAPVSDPPDNDQGAYYFVNSITQDAQGVVSATKRRIIRTGVWAPTYNPQGSATDPITQRGIVNFWKAVLFEEWTANTAYKRGAFLVYRSNQDGKSYICLEDHTSASSWTEEEASKWKVATIGDVLSYLYQSDMEKARVLDMFPAWTPSADYSTTDVVSHEGSLYKCAVEHTSGAEWDATEAENWVETPLSGINVKPRQAPVANPKADTATATTFVDTITQDENGVVKATRKPLGISSTATWSPTTGSGSTSQCLSQRGILQFRQTLICKDWAANTAYKKGVIVLPRTSNPLSCYECLEDHTSGSSWNSSEAEHWKSVTIADVFKSLQADKLDKANRVFYATSSTEPGTAAKTASTADGDFSLYEGAVVVVKFSETNTQNTPTLDIDGTGAKPIRRTGENQYASLLSAWYGNEAVPFVYDGTSWLILKPAAATTSLRGVVQLVSSVDASGMGDKSAPTPNAVKAALADKVKTPVYDGNNHYFANATDSTADIYGFDAIGTHNWTMARKGILYMRLMSASDNSSTVRIYVNEANQGHQILAMGMTNGVTVVPLFLNTDDMVILEISGNKLGYVQYSAFYTD